MNLPNKLTVARIIATPIFMAVMLADFKWSIFVSMIIFILASLTDMLDGKIARKRGLVTDFGKFLDPLADKMLTTAAFIGFLVWSVQNNGAIPGMEWILFIILFREFMITSLRLVAVGSGKVIAANIFGKLKTVIQMVSIIAILWFNSLPDICDTFGVYIPDLVNVIHGYVTTGLLWLTAVITVISGVIYIYENRECINQTK